MLKILNCHISSEILKKQQNPVLYKNANAELCGKKKSWNEKIRPFFRGVLFSKTIFSLGIATKIYRWRFVCYILCLPMCNVLFSSEDACSIDLLIWNQSGSVAKGASFRPHAFCCEIPKLRKRQFWDVRYPGPCSTASGKFGSKEFESFWCFRKFFFFRYVYVLVIFLIISSTNSTWNIFMLDNLSIFYFHRCHPTFPTFSVGRLLTNPGGGGDPAFSRPKRNTCRPELKGNV